MQKNPNRTVTDDKEKSRKSSTKKVKKYGLLETVYYTVNGKSKSHSFNHWYATKKAREEALKSFDKNKSFLRFCNKVEFQLIER